MVDAVRTKKLTREQIAAVVGNNPRAIKLFELLVDDVSTAIPAAIDEVQLSTLFSLHGADGSKSTSHSAAQIATEVQVLVSACQRATSAADELRGQVDLLRQELHDTQSRLKSAISILERTAQDALTLTIGA